LNFIEHEPWNVFQDETTIVAVIRPTTSQKANKTTVNQHFLTTYPIDLFMIAKEIC
jgi:hypothetical protein